MTVNERISALRAEMRTRGISAYIIPSDDFHCSEYVGDWFRAREFISGFTGSAGTVVVTPTEAGLWTDGRYFLQAADQLKGTCVTLYRDGQPGVPSIADYLTGVLKAGDRLGFDGRVMAETVVRGLLEKQPEGITLSSGEDLVDLIWKDRPPIAHTPVKVLPLSIAGLPTKDKLAAVRADMASCGADVFVLGVLDDINWLLNIRADDIHCNPVLLSFCVITPDRLRLFADRASFDPASLDYLSSVGAELLPYEEVYGFLRGSVSGKRVCIDPRRSNHELIDAVQGAAAVLERTNMTILMKGIKNDTEAANAVTAHIKDGVAVTKFLYWLKQNAGDPAMTELSASAKLEALRAEQPGFWGISFDTICAYGPHGAIVHYEPTPETDVPVLPKSFLLVDSGGHYDEGTTDITRTISMGPLTQEEKHFYTLVLRSHLALANAKFLKGCTGLNLDVLARGPLWDELVDYNHGTGHGVSCLMSVHEGPQGFRWRKSPTRSEDSPFYPNMITSDEPGLYFEGRFGIRLENLIICREGVKNEYGQFLYHDYLTMVPFDRDAILPEELTFRELAQLNDYHAQVFAAISPYLSGDEMAWLRAETAPL